MLIAGAGIGGLCLAQGLRAAGVRVSVFERDPALENRGQGYRIHIDDHGGEALRHCLPEHLYRLYLATSTRPGAGRISTLGTDLGVLSTLDTGTGSPHTAVNRLTLREILFAGLGSDVHFGHQVAAVEPDADGVRIRFGHGGERRGDVLVGADGVNSVVRAAVAPDSAPIDTGLRCVYGRTPLAALPGLPERFFDGFTAVAGGTVTLALAAFRARTPPEDAAGLALTPVPDYLMWAVVGAAPRAREPVALHRFAARAVRRWHPELVRIVREADVPATFRTPIRTSPPVPRRTAGRVTMLGDAIHVMPPSGGAGANTALRDAALLTRQLTATGADPLAAIAAYEHEMREYATAVVHRSNLAAGLARGRG
ncbi:2-polyprenyl-6-methoxyphenol hydroxylase [Amycolatopsis saalfeldensis]|uniref:2-polyprenyl-6-methoxyphenol hydroxylase n=1 Tax=Amycolatopsis saalfeldensis TaxID=394193 RepID=A0A1H8YLN1_9PSEU|nr:2-polyprenyl-6-methoxyphenol hydroxylase [Amycolatopsis saalfeldensis]